MRKCSYCGRENEEALTRCAICQTELGSVEQSVSELSQPINPLVVCPQCGAGDFRHLVSLRSSFSIPAFLAGGLIAVVFRNAAQERKVQCNQCGTSFKTRTAISKVSKFIFWLLISPAILLIALFLFNF